MNCDCSRCQTEGCNANYLCPCCLKAEVERLTAAMQRVRDLHTAELLGSGYVCRECGDPLTDQYPKCATLRALDGGAE